MKLDTKALTVEWAPFEAAEHVSDEQVIEAANAIETDFLQQQEGYVRRELLKGEGKQWVDLIYWLTPQYAAKAAESVGECQACMKYFSIMVEVDNAGEPISHYSRVKSWN
ncbi:MAG: hypothetical protein ACRBHB_15695 [Arenicella sp.]